MVRLSASEQSTASTAWPFHAITERATHLQRSHATPARYALSTTIYSPPGSAAAAAAAIAPKTCIPREHGNDPNGISATTSTEAFDAFQAGVLVIVPLGHQCILHWFLSLAIHSTAIDFRKHDQQPTLDFGPSVDTCEWTAFRFPAVRSV